MNNFGKIFSVLVLSWISILCQGLNSGSYGKEMSDNGSVDNSRNQFQIKTNGVSNIKGVSPFSASSGGNGNNGMTSGPFTSTSGRNNAGMGEGLFASSKNGGTNFNGGGSGVDGPFSVHSGNAQGSPFTISSGNTGKNGGSAGSGPFSSGSGNHGGPFASASGSNNAGMGKGPFASSSNGGGVGEGSPFSTNSGNAKGSPFTVSSGNTGRNGGGGGSSPFSSALGNGDGMPGVDYSSVLTSGPGGLVGGDFMPKNTSALMGHDYSKEYGGMNGIGKFQSVDNSRFDTSEYQHMLQDLFKSDKDTVDMGTPFDGSSYNYDTTSSAHVNTGQEASIGSYASTDMSSYAANSGAAKGQTLPQNQGINPDGTHYSNSHYSGGSYTNSIDSDTSTGTDMSYSSPFNVNNYDMNESNRGQSSHNNAVSPFKINNNFKIGGNSGIRTNSGPFSTSKSEGMGSGGESPFKVNQESSGKGQNPFDTSKYQASGSFGNEKRNYGNMASMEGGTSNQGLDEFGNVDFSKLSNLRGSSYNDVSSFTGRGSSYTGSESSFSGTGSSYSSHSSQYETPFESNNYNDLLENPFDSSKQDFQSPYQSGNNFHQSSYSGSQPVGYSNQGYGASGGGPAGDPFNQGSHSMQGPNMRG